MSGNSEKFREIPRNVVVYYHLSVISKLMSMDPMFVMVYYHLSVISKLMNMDPIFIEGIYHGDMCRGSLVWTCTSREGDMSW